MINFTSILYLPFIFIFLPSLAIFIGEKTFFAVIAAVIPVSYVFLLLKEKTGLYSRIKKLYKLTPLKDFMYIYYWILFSGLIAVLMGYYSFTRFLYVAVLAFVFRALFVYLYPALVAGKYISLNKILKIFTFAYFLIMIWGFIEFLGALLNIEIINNAVLLLSNIRKSLENSVIMDDFSGIPRIRSVFFEPSAYARFLTVTIPLIYELALNKFKIFKNKFLNLTVKKSLVPFALISIILTQSPIFIIFFILTTLIYFNKEIIRFIIKHKIILSILFLGFVILLYMLSVLSFDPSKSFLKRIINVLEVLPKMSLDLFILAEPSLATRVVNNINQFLIFLQHPITGVGFGNTGEFLINFFTHSPVPLTIEMQEKLLNAKNTMPMTTNAMYLLLYQTGIVGFILYCRFMIKNIKILDKLKKYFSGSKYYFISGLKKTTLAIFIVSILYEQWFMDEYLFFITGLVCAIIIVAQKIKMHY